MLEVDAAGYGCEGAEGQRTATDSGAVHRVDAVSLDAVEDARVPRDRDADRAGQSDRVAEPGRAPVRGGERGKGVAVRADRPAPTAFENGGGDPGPAETQRRDRTAEPAADDDRAGTRCRRGVRPGCDGGVQRAEGAEAGGADQNGTARDALGGNVSFHET